MIPEIIRYNLEILAALCIIVTRDRGPWLSASGCRQGGDGIESLDLKMASTASMSDSRL